jgi:hypothetical protein
MQQNASQRFTPEHVQQWRDEGFAIIPNFFSAAEIAPVYAEYERIYGTHADQTISAMVDGDEDEQAAAFRKLQFKNIDNFPFDASPEMNLISLHPALIDFASAVLGVDSVHLYQSHTWAKYTGETNYEQAHHCDFGNHTLLVPSETAALRTVDFILYITDVTDALGALHYVPKPAAAQVLKPGAVAVSAELQGALLSREKSAAGPAGTLVAHSIDTFHRGTNLTLENGYRYTMTAGYKASGNELIGYHVWQESAGRNWSGIFDHASPQQLACLGIPLPGDAYWTLRTLKLSQARWPGWDMRAYFAAHS